MDLGQDEFGQKKRLFDLIYKEGKIISNLIKMQKNEILENYRNQDSGLRNFDSTQFQANLKKIQKQNLNQENLEDFFNLVRDKKFFELIDQLKQDPSLENSLEIRALKIISKMASKSPIQIEDFIANNLNNLRELIAYPLSKNILNFYKQLQENTEDFPELDFWALRDIFVEIIFYYLLDQLHKKEKNLLDKIEFYQNSSGDLYRSYYLKFLHYRINQDLEAEEKFLKFYLANSQDRSIALVSLATKAEASNYQDFLNAVDEKLSEIELYAGLFNKTCEYFECNDCCKFSHPSMGFAEYLHLKKWLEDTAYDTEALKIRCEQIQEQSLRILSRRLVLKENLSEDQNFKFTCPFLIDNQCSCYEARPLSCRGFGMMTENGTSIKSCNFYIAQYEHNSNPDGQWFVWNIENEQAKLASLNQSSKFRGSIVAWFTQ